MIAQENRFHAPKRYIPEEDLLWAIEHAWQDAGDCRMELYRRGWSDAAILGYLENQRRLRELRAGAEVK